MRTSAFLLACLFSALAQDASDGRTSFSFAGEQGWALSTDADGDFPDIQENDLQEGLNPRFRPPLTRPTFPTRDRDNKVRPRGRGTHTSTVALGSGRRTTKDPLKLEGSLLLLPDGGCLFQFKRIEYWDHTQRYWIDFEAEKIRTHQLGGLEKWSGSRSDWSSRLEKLEGAFIDAYLRVLTPQKPAAVDKIGLEGSSAPEPAWRLFVATSLEEQLAALLLARLDGIPLDLAAWPAVAARYPERPQLQARALIDRIRAQAAGTFAPDSAKVRPGRTLKDEAWLGTEIAIPSMAWKDGRAWATERLKPVEDARARLKALADASARTAFGKAGWMDPDVWRSAVEDEAKSLRKTVILPSLDRAPGLEDALVPWTRAAGPATYDFKEKSDVHDGRVQSSDADVRGTAHDLEVFFFHSGQNVWKTSFVKVETWYRGKVRRD
jgi:hypothetical protein